MRIRIFITVFLSFNLITSCGSMAKSDANYEFTEENKAIPPKFGENTNMCMLFILKDDIGHLKTYNTVLKKNVEKFYKGKYELITQDQLFEDRYNDLQKFRYIFDFSNGASISRNNSFKRFHINDRFNNIIYESGYSNIKYEILIKVYLEKLNKKI